MSHDALLGLEEALSEFRRHWTDLQNRGSDLRNQVAALESDKTALGKKLEQAAADAVFHNAKIRTLGEDVERLERDRRELEKKHASERESLLEKIEDAGDDSRLLRARLADSERRALEEKRQLEIRVTELETQRRERGHDLERVRRAEIILQQELRRVVILEEKLKGAEARVRHAEETSRELQSKWQDEVVRNGELRSRLENLSGAAEDAVRSQNKVRDLEATIQLWTKAFERIENGQRSERDEMQSWKNRFMEANGRVVSLSQELADLRADAAEKKQVDPNYLQRAEAAEAQAGQLRAQLQTQQRQAEQNESRLSNELQNWRRRALEAEREVSAVAERLENARRQADRDRRQLEETHEQRLGDLRRQHQTAEINAMNEELRRQRETIRQSLDDLRSAAPAGNGGWPAQEQASENLKRSIRHAQRKSADPARILNLLDKLGANFPGFDEAKATANDTAANDTPTSNEPLPKTTNRG